MVRRPALRAGRRYLYYIRRMNTKPKLLLLPALLWACCAFAQKTLLYCGRLIDPKTDQRLFGILALTLVYAAYVAEVYRAGIESIHPSQDAAARSLGLSRLQSLRHVVIPQAIRRVIPPLLNDFIGLQKDTVLVSFIGVVEIFRYSQIASAATYNFTPYVAVGLVFVVVTVPLIHVVDWLVGRDRGQLSVLGAVR